MEQGLIFEAETEPMADTCDAAIDRAIVALIESHASCVSITRVFWQTQKMDMKVPVSRIPARLSRAVRLGILRREGASFFAA